MEKATSYLTVLPTGGDERINFMQKVETEFEAMNYEERIKFLHQLADIRMLIIDLYFELSHK